MNINRLAHRVLDGGINPQDLTSDQLDAVIEIFEIWMDHYTFDPPMNDWDYEPPGLSTKLDELKELRGFGRHK